MAVNSSEKVIQGDKQKYVQSELSVSCWEPSQGCMLMGPGGPSHPVDQWGPIWDHLELLEL